MGLPISLQKGAVPALSPSFEDRHLAETIANLRKVRDYAVEKLNSVEGMRVSSPEGTNLLLPDISSFGMNSMEFCKYLLNEAGVACAPGAAYHAEGRIRISLGSERIREAIDRVVAAVSKLPTKNVEKRIVVRA
jgi:aminotransferase